MNPYLARALAEQQDRDAALVDETGYDAHTIPELRDAIDVRNTDRDPEGETYIKPNGTKKGDLIAALEADDAAQAAENKES